MHRMILLFFFLPFLSHGQQTVTAIREVMIIDVEKGKLLPPQTVLIEGNRIGKIGPKIFIPPGALIIDGRGKYLVPGLVDFNAGVVNYEHQQEPALLLLLANGITTVRDLQPRVPLSFGRALKQDLETGKRTGPRLYLLSHLITSRGTREKRIVVQTAEEAFAAVDASAKEGADLIKLDYTLSPSLTRAVVSRAKQHLLPTVAGISTSFIDASAAGISMIDHATDLRRVTSRNRERYFQFYLNDSNRIVSREEFYNRLLPSLGETDSAYFREVIRTMRKNNTWLVIGPASQMPSVIRFEMQDSARQVYRSARQRAALQQAIKENEKIAGLDRYKSFVDLQEIRWAYALGLGVVAGSQFYDFITPGFSLHDSFYWMQENGFAPIDILRTATINPARFLKKEKDWGSVKRGKLADLVLIDANPLTDIGHLKKISAVVINGKVFDRAALDSLLQQARQEAAR
jgi:hypothetical protein